MKKLLYYIMAFIEHGLEGEIIKVLKKEKKLTVFDVGCYRGVFSKKGPRKLVFRHFYATLVLPDFCFQQILQKATAIRKN